jgi:hypothetical protein
MHSFVLAPNAVTYYGEWVTPRTAEQMDYDSLFCASCTLKLGVHIDPLTGLKNFVHTPLQLETSNLIATCAYSKVAGGNTEFGPLRATEPRQPPSKTVKQHWQCCWCHLCWNGEIVCPQCKDWLYAISI